MTLHGGHLSGDSSVKFIRMDTFTQAIGFSVFAFEGIGICIPVYEIAEDKEGFLKVLYLVFITVCSLYVAFGLMCVEAFGHDLSSPLITTVALP